MKPHFLVSHAVSQTHAVQLDAFKELTYPLGHFLHNVGGNIGDGCVAQQLEKGVAALQLHGADASIIGMGV